MDTRTPDSVDHAAIDRLGDEIAELSAHLEAATARLLDLIREFDAREGWNNGFRSCAAWLSWRVGYAPGAAREHVRVARALGSLPLLSQALARGELSYAKVRELTRVATPETEAKLFAVGRTGTAEHVERIVRGWRRMDRKAEAQEAARHHTSRALHVYQDEDGAVRIRGRLAPEVGAVLLKALEAARESLYRQRHEEAPDADPPTMEQQQADALALLAETALHQGIDPGTAGERYQVVVHVDAAVPCSRAACAFRPERRSVWLAMQPGSSCATTPRGVCSRSAPGHARFRRRYAARFTTATTAVASPAAACASARAITSATGPMAARQRSRTSPCCVVGIIARSTRRATR